MHRIHLLAALVLAMAGVYPAAAQTLKIATIAPEGSSWMKDMRAGAEEISKRTEGRVTIKFYGGGVQGNDKQVQRKMRTGQLHGGAFTSSELTRFHRDAGLFGLPLVFHTLEEVHAVRAELEGVLRQRLEEAGYVNFGFAGGGFAYMMSNQPLQTLEDIKRQKVWTPEGDEASYTALQALGISPVTMPLTDVLTGLQTDLLNSVTVPPVGAVVLQWHTRLEYISDLPVAYVYAGMLVERSAFERLQPADQKVAREVLEGIYRNFDAHGEEDNEKALEALLQSGLQRVRPADEEARSWREIVSRSHLQQAQQGVFDLELFTRLQSVLQAYRAGQAARVREN